MTKKMLIDASHPEETRVAVVNNGRVEDFDFESQSRKPLRGNIYLARITRIEPSLQAAFVEYGGNRHGFLAFSEIHSDYYQIPVADREILRKAEELEAQLAAEIEQSSKDLEDDDEDGDESETPESEENEAHASNEDDDDALSEDHPSEDEADDIAGEEITIESAGYETSSSDDDHDSDDSDAADDEEDNDGEIVANNDSDESDSEFSEVPDHDEDDSSGARDRAALMAEADERITAEIGNAQSEATKRLRDLQERFRQAKRDRANLLRNYRIQEVIKRRQILLIQVVKEERGNKGAALTTYMSLAGRYCVLMPNTARGGGISRKIAMSADRKRLRKAMEELDIPQGIGLIIRTAGAKRTKAEIKRDYEYLLRLWENIRELTLKSIAPSLIYEEANLIKRAIRDLYDKDIDQITVEGEAGYREAKDFMKMLMPSHAKFVQPYKESVPLFIQYKVEHQLDEMYQPVVKLKSGGYLVIQQTEALVSIDVNSGKATRERNIESTALKTNAEAAREVARQCRLRDLAGLIVVDFIDMEEGRNNRAVEKRLKDSMKTDRARIQIGRISNFGLLEFSRQRRRSGIVDGTTKICPSCHGAGNVRSDETAALRILRATEDECIRGKTGQMVVTTSTEVALFILNHKRDWLRRIEETYGVAINVSADSTKSGDSFEIEHLGEARERRVPAPSVVRADQQDVMDDVEEEVSEEESSDSDEADEASAEDDDRPRRKRRRRRRKPNADGEDKQSVEDSAEKEIETSDEDNHSSDSKSSTSDGDDDDKAGKRNRRRGRRGGRRNRRRDKPEGEEGSAIDAEGEQPEMVLATDTDETAASSDEPESAESNQEAASETPPKRERRPRRRARKSVTEVTASEDTPASVEKEVSASAPIDAEPVMPSVREIVQEEQPANDVNTDTPDDDSKPRKRGWWQRALKG